MDALLARLITPDHHPMPTPAERLAVLRDLEVRAKQASIDLLNDMPEKSIRVFLTDAGPEGFWRSKGLGNEAAVVEVIDLRTGK